jgi:TolB-like protein
MDRLIEEHGGRIANTAGDSVVASFPSAVDAVQCAVEVQNALADLNTGVDADRTLRFRIGVHVGDVLVRGTDLLGDGVNIAARLEGIAEPGGVCVSGAAYDYVRKTLPLTFTDLGPQQVKNIEEPIRAYAIATIGPKQPAGANDPASTNFYALPDKPSLVVLPFTSLSSGAEHEAFIEGMVEDITAALAQAVDITVASRPSTLTLKSKAPDAREVARDLGVRYLVQGSVRRSGSRIRVSAQLTDGISGLQLWSGRYDRVFDDLFIVQDEITQEVASALEVQLAQGEQAAFRRKQTTSSEAWDLYVRGSVHLRAANIPLARSLLEKAVCADPFFPSAWARLGQSYFTEARFARSGDAALERGVAAAKQGLEVDNTNSDAWAVLGGLRTFQRRYQEALECGEKAIALAPSIADHYAIYAFTLNMVGRPRDALASMQTALRLRPFPPDYYFGIQAASYYLLGQTDESMKIDQAILTRSPGYLFSRLRMMAICAERGEVEQANLHARDVLRQHPDLTLSKLPLMEPYQDESKLRPLLMSLRKAGLPE